MMKLKILHIISDLKKKNGGPPIILNNIQKNFNKNKKLSDVSVFFFQKKN